MSSPFTDASGPGCDRALVGGRHFESFDLGELEPAELLVFGTELSRLAGAFVAAKRHDEHLDRGSNLVDPTVEDSHRLDYKTELLEDLPSHTHLRIFPELELSAR